MSKGKQIAGFIKKNRKVVLGIVIFAVLIVAVYVIFGVVRHNMQRKSNKQGLSAVQTTTLKKRDLTTSVSVA